MIDSEQITNPRFAPTAAPMVALRFALAALLGSAMVDAQPNAAAERGRVLFTSGLHADGTPIRATNADTGVSLPPAFVACEKCHGYDARGKTEAGVTVSDIRWDTLTKPYPLPRADGRPRAPYDEALFFRAVTAGRDSRGEPLGSTMPRYLLSESETTDIAAYLASIDAVDDQGVTDEIIRLGFAGPGASSDPSESSAAEQWLQNWANSVNRRGGVFRRTIEWVQMTDADAVGRSPVLAVVLLDGANESIADGCARRAVPCLRITDGIDPARRPREFAFRPSRPARVSNLIRYGMRHDAISPSAIAVLASARMSVVESEAIRRAADTIGVTMMVIVDPTKVSGLPAALRSAGARDVVLAGPAGDFMSLFERSGTSYRRLRFLLTDELPGSAAKFSGLEVTGLEWAVPSDVSDSAKAAFRSPTPTAADTALLDPAAWSLMATVKLLEAALDRAGRVINRDRLIDTLESLQGVRTGFAPPAGFTPTRHIAAAGSYLVPLAQPDAQGAPEWIPADPGS